MQFTLKNYIEGESLEEKGHHLCIRINKILDVFARLKQGEPKMALSRML